MIRLWSPRALSVLIILADQISCRVSSFDTDPQPTFQLILKTGPRRLYFRRFMYRKTGRGVPLLR